MLPFVEVGIELPLDPGISRQWLTQLGELPLSPVDLNLHIVNPNCWCPRNTGDRVRPGVDLRPIPWPVDTRLRLDRSLFGPASGNPVPVERVPRRELDLREPFRGRYIAVQAWNNQPGGETMARREHLTVHTDDEHRVAVVERELGGEPRRPSIDRPTDNLFRTLLNTCHVENVTKEHASPQRVTHKPAPDLVGNTRQRRVSLDHGH